MSSLLLWLGGFGCGCGTAAWVWRRHFRRLQGEYRLLQWELVQAYKELSRRSRPPKPPAWFPVEESER